MGQENEEFTLGACWQNKKSPHREKLYVSAVEPFAVRGIESNEPKAEITREKLEASYKYVGRFIAEGDGKPKFVPLERLASRPEPVETVTASTESRVAAGQRYASKDDPSDTYVILGAGEKPETWNAHAQRDDVKCVVTTIGIVQEWTLLIDPFAPSIAPERTADPADPPLTEPGVEEASDEENTGSGTWVCGDDYGPDLGALELVFYGRLRDVSVEFKNKEGRLICPGCHGAQLIENGTLKEFLEAAAEFLDLHHRHVNPMPKPGELPFKGTMPGKAESGPAASPPPNGDAAPVTETAGTVVS